MSWLKTCNAVVNDHFSRPPFWQRVPSQSTNNSTLLVSMAIRLPTAIVKTKSPQSKVLKNACFVGAAMTLGDFGCQSIEQWGGDGQFSWDCKRTLRMGVTGVFVTTPVSYTWNLLAERLAPGTSWRGILGKLGVQVVAMPPMLAVQFASLTLLEEGKTMEDVRCRLSEDLGPTIKIGICYWPTVGILCSRFVPVMNRPGVSSIAGLFWNIYISHQANHKQVTDEGTPVSHSSENAKAPDEDTLRDSTTGAVGVVNAPAVGTTSEATSLKTETRARSVKSNDGDTKSASDKDTSERRERQKLVRRTTCLSM